MNAFQTVGNGLSSMRRAGAPGSAGLRRTGRNPARRWASPPGPWRLARRPDAPGRRRGARTREAPIGVSREHLLDGLGAGLGDANGPADVGIVLPGDVDAQGLADGGQEVLAIDGPLG